MENLPSYRILGQSLCQMINNKKPLRIRWRDGWWHNHWSENKRVWSFHRKAEDSDALSTWGRENIPESGARAGENKTWSQTAFWYGFHPHLEYKGETEKMIEEIVVAHSKECALEDNVELGHWSSITPVKESCVQCNPSQEASAVFFLKFAWYL